MRIETLLCDLPPLATTAQVARALGLTTRTVERYVARGRLPGLKLGPGGKHPVRVAREDVVHFLEEARARVAARAAMNHESAGA